MTDCFRVFVIHKSEPHKTHWPKSVANHIFMWSSDWSSVDLKIKNLEEIVFVLTTIIALLLRHSFSPEKNLRQIPFLQWRMDAQLARNPVFFELRELWLVIVLRVCNTQVQGAFFKGIWYQTNAQQCWLEIAQDAMVTVLYTTMW